MKKILIGLMLCGLSTAAFAQKAPSLVTVDVNKALAGYQRLQEAQVKFEASVTTAREELEAESEKLKVAVEEINKIQETAQNPALTEEKIQELQDQLQEKVAAYRQLEASFNQMRQRTEKTLADRRNNILSLHLDEVKDAIKQVCKTRGANLALNVEGNVVVFADSVFDVTNDVVQVLNTTVPPKSE
jgi:Skp family chaperone for outer membrane proteins